MKSWIRFINIVICILTVVAGANCLAQDPGLPDTVKIEGGPLIVGRSIPLTFTVVNDELVRGNTSGLIIFSDDGGCAKYDSVVYINRQNDPSVMDFRLIRSRKETCIGYDSLHVVNGTWFGNPLPPGNDPILLLYFTGISTGHITIDSSYFPPGAPFALQRWDYINSYTPQFTSTTIEIIEGTLPPELTVPDSYISSIAGQTVGFEIEGYSPEDLQITLELIELAGYDDDTRLPENTPTLSEANPALFEWDVTANDIGVWTAVFRICDTEELCEVNSVVIQVVESLYYLVDMDIDEITGVCNANGLAHGNFDDDDNPELFISGTGSNLTPTMALYDLNLSEGWQRVFAHEDMEPKFGSQTGYYNDDGNLDVLLMGFENGPYRVLTAEGDGANSFSLSGFSNDGHVTRNIICGEFTGDNYIDAASTWHDGVRIYAGNEQGDFSYISIIPTFDSAVTVNCADFNEDGVDDLAIGTKSGIKIYLGDGVGGFTEEEFHSQVYATLDVEITNNGSDFNDDNIYDLCISTPSVGGERSEIVIYLGNGDGTFSQHVIHDIRGQVFGNCVGDFNNDNQLDIAFVNGSQKYIGILFGEGDGSFSNEMRYEIANHVPQYIDCFDADLDGDLDLMAASVSVMQGNSLYYLENQTNPAGYLPQSLTLTAYDNASIELNSSDGKVFNRIKNVMPSGEYYRRNVDPNDIIDDYLVLGVVENEAYTIDALPKPNVTEGESFTLEFTINGRLYRLAKDMPMRPEGYQFTFYAGDHFPAVPRPGKITHINPPTFMWLGDGQFDFQLAGDYDFNNILYDLTIDGNEFTTDEPLDVTDTTTYYWRIKPVGEPDYDCLYVINIYPNPGNHCGDANNDGIVNIGDAVFLISHIFKGGPPPNPIGKGDANCDGNTNVGDAVYIINVVFKGGPGTCDDCDIAW
ncbi:MAG: FG-GAP-like repeat-containing protein [candidate division Zixibacteria bacterium]